MTEWLKLPAYLYGVYSAPSRDEIARGVYPEPRNVTELNMV